MVAGDPGKFRACSAGMFMRMLITINPELIKRSNAVPVDEIFTVLSLLLITFPLGL